MKSLNLDTILKYVLIVYLLVFSIVLIRNLQNGRYQSAASGNLIIDTRTGNVYRIADKIVDKP